MSVSFASKRVLARRRFAFTLVELLVVIGIIALLISILLPSLNRAREQARRTKCLSNIRNVGMALTMYADQFKGRLPMHTGGGSWLWDVPIKTRDSIASGGSPRDVLYCPSQQDRDHDGLWDYNPNFAVFGYFFLHKRHPNVPNAAPANGPWPALPPTLLNKDYLDRVSMSRASDRELLTDAVLSQNGSFVNVIGGFGKLPDSTNHYRQATNLPEGGNILFLDGHGEWRNFDDMKDRCAQGSVHFWF